jgi:hypothetical protein
MSGMAVPLGGGAKSLAAKPREKGKKGEAALSELLAGWLIRNPSLWGLVNDKLRAAAIEHLDSMGMLGVLIELLQEQACTDPEEVIARWPEEISYSSAIDLAKSSSTLPAEEIKKGFIEGVENLVKTLELSRRKAQLALQSDPNIEDLRSFVRRPKDRSDL